MQYLFFRVIIHIPLDVYITLDICIRKVSLISNTILK